MLWSVQNALFFLLVIKEGTCVRERGEKIQTIGDKAVRQIDVLGTGHVTFPLVKQTTDHSAGTTLFSPPPMPDRIIAWNGQVVHSCFLSLVWFIRGIGIYKNMFLDQWVQTTHLSEHSKIKLDRVNGKLPGREAKCVDWSYINCPTCRA